MDIQKKLNSTFLIVFALLMGLGAHYFQHNQGGSGLELAQNNVVWIFFSILIGLGLWKITEAQKIFYSRFTIVFLIAFLLFLIPIFYPNNELAEQSYTRLIGLFAGFLLFVSLQQMRFSAAFIQRLLLLIVLAGFLQACYSLTQDYLLPADNIFGYDVGYGRPYGIFQQPNVLASFMATTLILAGYLLQKIECKKTQAFLLITALLNMWVITVAVSRVGFVGSAVALLMFAPWAWQQNKKKLSLFVVVIFLGLGFGSLKGADTLQVRANGGAGTGESIYQDSQRLRNMNHTFEIFKEAPLLGKGYGSFEKEFLISYAKRVKEGELPPKSKHYTHPHNDTLFWAVEGGVIPIIGILLLAIGFLSLIRRHNLTKAMALMSLVLPITLHTQTEYPLYHSTLHWLVLIVLVFYVDNKLESIEKQQFRPTFALRIFALLIPIFAVFFMVTNLYTISKITEYERSKKPDIRLLMDIVNPLVFQDRFDFHLSHFRLAIAVQTGNQEEIKEVIKWTEKTLEKTPKSFFYIILYLAYKHNDELEKAEQRLEYARYLFPGDKQLAGIDKPPASRANKTTSNALSTTIKTD